MDPIDTPPIPHPIPPQIRVGICVLNYHQPEVTASCIRRLLEVEGPEARILWLENDFDTTCAEVTRVLDQSGLRWRRMDPGQDGLPDSGEIAFIPIPRNLGYAAGNNIGLACLHHLGVEFAWVLNNDTWLLKGSSRDLVREAENTPDVGLWGTCIRADHTRPYFGGIVQLKDFSITYAHEAASLSRSELCFISGCSMFLRTQTAKDVGWIPDDYFLYYEDPAFSLEIRKAGKSLGYCPSVEVRHMESLSIGRRSDLMEFYNRRNRWLFIQRYFPERLEQQIRRRWYCYQKLLFRGKFKRLDIERLALLDYCDGRTGPTHRDFT